MNFTHLFENEAAINEEIIEIHMRYLLNKRNDNRNHVFFRFARSLNVCTAGVVTRDLIARIAQKFVNVVADIDTPFTLDELYLFFGIARSSEKEPDATATDVSAKYAQVLKRTAPNGISTCLDVLNDHNDNGNVRYVSGCKKVYREDFRYCLRLVGSKQRYHVLDIDECAHFVNTFGMDYMPNPTDLQFYSNKQFLKADSTLLQPRMSVPNTFRGLKLFDRMKRCVYTLENLHS